MPIGTKIEWTDVTLNLWWGCVEVHAGCDNCYARLWARRFQNKLGVLWGARVPRLEIKSWRKTLYKAQNEAAAADDVYNVFVGSMMDIFEKPQPVANKNYNTGKLRDELFDMINAGEFPNLHFQFLTKRPSNINKYIPESWKTKPPKNVVFGTTVVDQKTADKYIPELLAVKGKKFLSVEPQLDFITLKPYIRKIDWVINGGESGGKRRPFDPDWARSLRDECKKAGVPFFMKQIDKVIPIPRDLRIRQFPS